MKPVTKLTDLDQHLSQVYYDASHSASFGGIATVYLAAKEKGIKTTRQKVREWMQHQDTYTLHKPVRWKFPRARVIVGGMDQQWQADLADVSSLAKYNSGFRYILTCIDILSKYAWAIPLKDKRGVTLVAAFEQILKTGRKPEKLQTDQGKEFVNHLFQKFLKSEDIQFFTTGNKTKASVVERFNRTLKTKMWKYFTRNNTLSYLSVLPQLMQSYNNTWHRSIKRKPASVNKTNEKEVWDTLYSDYEQKTVKFKFSVGEQVRISKTKRYYDDFGSILTTLREQGLPDNVQLTFDPVSRKVTVDVSDGTSLYFLPGLAEIMGFYPDTILRQKSDAPFMFSVRNLSSLCVYCNLVDDHVEEGQWEEVHPLTHSVESGPIEFVISGSGEDYIDLSSTLLLIKAEITKVDGTNLGEDAAYLMNGVELRLKLNRSKNALSLVSSAENPGFKAVVTEATLLVRKIKLSPSVQLGHAEALKQGLSKYPLHRCVMKVLSIPGGTMSFNKDHIFLGQLPKRVVLGLVDNDAFNGSYKKNPFNFKHYGMTSLVLNVGGNKFRASP
ncbi:uncharacterized protein [Ptychodera flava]|uniref:uncharacterized protein n=1 Tax=Ptychodera flava TaxID=63121 RepID=UPI00396A1869